MNNRLTLDDLLEQRSSDDFDLVQDRRNGKPRVIRRKTAKPPLELYENEKELKKAAADMLERLPRCKLLKTDNMPLLVGRGVRVKTREPGMSDQHLCIRGLFVAIEAKMPGKDLDPDQIDYKASILSAEGIFIVYHSLYELVEELKKYRLISQKFEIR